MLSIIIRTYNEEKFIGKLLKTIFNQKVKHKYEVIVVDSGSTDNTIPIVLKFPVKLIRIPKEKFSFGYSLNKGIENSNGNICIFISAHCIPYNNEWLLEIVQPFENKNIGMVYGRQIGDKILTKFSEHQIFKKWFPEYSFLEQSYPFANNANSAIRKNLWEEVKFDETLTGLEDIKWAKDIMELGFKIYYNANAVVYHIHEEKYIQIYNRYKREAIALKKIFPELHFNLFDFIKLFISNTTQDYLYAINNKVLIRNLISIPLFRLMQFWGTYRGYKFRYDSLTEQLRERFYYPVKDKNEIKELKLEEQEVLN